MKKSIFDNNTFIMVLSVLIAVLIWVVVAYNVDTTIPSTITNVPVNINTSDSNLVRNGLYPIADSLEFTVDVEVIGPRATIGNLRPSDIQVEARLNNVTGPGTYELVLEVQDIRNRDIEIMGTTPEMISLRFDRHATKTLPVNLEMTGVTIPDGYVMDAESIFPTEVEVTGPASEMENVRTAEVSLEFTEPITDSVTQDIPVKLYDARGNAVESPYFEFDSDKISVTVPVLKKKIVPVTFDYVNIPDEFDTDTLNYTITPSEVEIAGPEGMLSSFNEIHVGYIDMRNLAPDVSFFYDLELPDGFISVEGVEDLNLRYVPEGFGEKQLTIESDSIYVINASDDYEVTIQSRSIPGVIVYGPEDDLEMITANDLVAQVDMNQVEYKIGQVTVPVEIILNANETCWAYGTHYTVRATIKGND